MLSPIALVLLAVPAFWLYAEFKLGRAARICLGIASIISIAFVASELSSIMPIEESVLHGSSLKLAGQLMASGQTVRVQQAIDAYNGQASTGSTYSAAGEMWDVLNHGSKH
jgi:hypothetical protein